MLKDYKIIEKGHHHVLIKAPMNYYMFIPIKEFKEDDKYLDRLWSAGLYIVDVELFLKNMVF